MIRERVYVDANTAEVINLFSTINNALSYVLLLVHFITIIND